MTIALFDFIAMTRALWLLFGVEVLRNIGAVLACFVSPSSKRVALHSVLICAVPAAATLAFGFGLVQNFLASGATAEEAATMASGQLTMLNAIWLWLPFAIVPVVAMVLSLLIKRSGRMRRSLDIDRPNAGGVHRCRG